ncbi:MAG: hypothetical protein LVS60_14665 [Nodosilinea sp. LVE1205-7]|jgi:ABC-type dipeptide/oligopeptide/nickel transport system ATPase component
MTVLLDTRHLSTRLVTQHGVIYAVNDVSFQVHRGKPWGWWGSRARARV